jgi:NTE family protein
MPRLPALWFAACLLVLAPVADARERVGLVLSGGGARGAAHVGALKVLDDLQVPVDVVVGTSMGAVVGGLYASGLSGREIESLMNNVDWQDAFRDRPSRSELGIRRKRDDQEFLVQVPLGFRDGRFVLPRGIVQGQKLARLLREMTLPVAFTQDFDRLPRRFRAVATDLETGQPVVLGRGDLVTAIRASLSAPGLFTPVEHDGRLLVDGGVAENLPIQVARELGVDRLIVVDVSSPLLPRGELETVTSVSNQMLAILMRRDIERQRATLGAQDIIIDPALGDLSAFDFSGLPRAIEAGQRAAEALRPRLLAMAAGLGSSAAGAAPPAVPLPVIDFVRVAPGAEVYAAPIEALFGELRGRPLDTALLSRRMSRLYSRGTFETIEYRLASSDPQDPLAGKGLEFAARPRSWGPNYLRFGLRLQDDFSGNSSYEAALRYVMTDLSRFGAEWTTDLHLGANPGLATEVFLPFSDQQRYFLMPRAAVGQRNLPRIVDEEQVGDYRVSSSVVGLDVGREFGNVAEFRLGLERKWGSTRLRLGDVGELDDPPVDFSASEWFARYSYDSIDRAAFPREGDLLTLEWRGQAPGGPDADDSDLLRLDWRHVRSRGRTTFIASASAGTMLQPSRADPRSYFSLGGFLNLSGLTPDALSAPHFGIGRFTVVRRIGDAGEGLFNLPLYLGGSLEAGNTWLRRDDIGGSTLRKDASLFLGMDTLLGPVYVAAGYDDRGRSAFYLFLGRGF